MKKLAIVLALMICGCTKEQGAELLGQGLGEVAKIGGCVLQSIVEGGVTDPKDIIGKCGKATVHDIADLTDGWLAQLTPTDGGHPAAMSPSRAALVLANDRAKSAIDAGAK